MALEHIGYRVMVLEETGETGRACDRVFKRAEDAYTWMEENPCNEELQYYLEDVEVYRDYCREIEYSDDEA